MERKSLNKEKESVCLVVEGEEEVDYLKRLISLGIFNSLLFIDIKNARSIDNIYMIYLNTYQQNSYDKIFIVCDTEIYPYTQFTNLRKKIGRFYKDNGLKVDLDKLIYFTNPCIMQLILSHFAKVSLTESKKEKNEMIIEKYLGVSTYRAEQKQREKIMNQITDINYLKMKKNISLLPLDYRECPSTNILSLFEMLETGKIDQV